MEMSEYMYLEQTWDSIIINTLSQIDFLCFKGFIAYKNVFYLFLNTLHHTYYSHVFAEMFSGSEVV